MMAGGGRRDDSGRSANPPRKAPARKSAACRVQHVGIAGVAALERLRVRLEREGFALTSGVGMLFRARAAGVVATAYRSGKILVQGRGTPSFVQRFLPEEDRESPARTEPGQGSIGSDESGKGDWFGPLVIAATFIPSGDRGRIRRLGVTDSKQMSDRSVREAARALRGLVAHRILCWNPAAYNVIYAEVRNLNRILARAHAEVLAPLLRAHRDSPAVVDQFGKEELLVRELAARGIPPGRVEQRPRAESDIAVAAASVLARERFLRELEGLARVVGVPLPKGAGPDVERAGREIHAKGGLEALRGVAKLHFTTTSRVAPVWESES